MQKTKHKDCLPTKTSPTKIFDLEILQGDLIYVGNEIIAKSKEHALQIMILMSGGEITEDSEIISFEERTFH